VTGVALGLVVAVAGGLGAATRFVVDGVVRRRFPLLPTLVVNVTGSFLLGVVAGLVLREAVPAATGTVLGTGFLGGYTTFGTASTETVRLLEHRRYVAAAVTSAGMLVLSVGACAAGIALASADGVTPVST
jgi:CrcB protein